jgi:hypothetical protein
MRKEAAWQCQLLEATEIPYVAFGEWQCRKAQVPVPLGPRVSSYGPEKH